MRLATTALFVLSTLFAFAAHAQDGEQANAEQLLDRAQQALAVTVAMARADAGPGVEDAKAKPFWDGPKDVGNNLENSKPKPVSNRILSCCLAPAGDVSRDARGVEVSLRKRTCWGIPGTKYRSCLGIELTRQPMTTS